MSRRGPFGRRRQRAVSRALALVALCTAAPVGAAPEPVGAIADLARAPLTVSGDVIGGAGLLGAALVATLGDAIAFADDNVVLRGVASGAVHEVARALSWGGTASLEILRWEEVERLPEARATYRDAAPFTGRLDTAFAGLGALNLAVRDALLAPPGALLRAVGAQGAAEAVAAHRTDAALRLLGPAPACDLPGPCGP